MLPWRVTGLKETNPSLIVWRCSSKKWQDRRNENAEQQRQEGTQGRSLSTLWNITRWCEKEWWERKCYLTIQLFRRKFLYSSRCWHQDLGIEWEMKKGESLWRLLFLTLLVKTRENRVGITGKKKNMKCRFSWAPITESSARCLVLF